MEIIPKTGIGEFKFTMHRRDIISMLGRPDLMHINELVHPGVIYDQYSKRGLRFYYDFRTDLYPFCIEASKKSKATLLGDSLFDKTFAYIRTEFFEKHDLTCVFFGNNHIRAEELSTEFDYFGLELNDNTKIRAIMAFIPGKENLFFERFCEPQQRLLSAEERALKYAKYYDI
jgi:hypothetical protein